MLKQDLSVGMEVIDTWYPNFGIGIVSKVLNPRVEVDFPNQDMVYINKWVRVLDLPHTQFFKDVDPYYERPE